MHSILYLLDRWCYFLTLRLSPTAHAKADPNAKCILHSVFTSQNHASTEDAFKPAILRSSGVGRQKKHRRERRRKTHRERGRSDRRGPAQGQGRWRSVEARLPSWSPDLRCTTGSPMGSPPMSRKRAAARLLPRERLRAGVRASDSAPAAARAAPRRWLGEPG